MLLMVTNSHSRPTYENWIQAGAMHEQSLKSWWMGHMGAFLVATSPVLGFVFRASLRSLGLLAFFIFDVLTFGVYKKRKEEREKQDLIEAGVIKPEEELPNPRQLPNTAISRRERRKEEQKASRGDRLYTFVEPKA